MEVCGVQEIAGEGEPQRYRLKALGPPVEDWDPLFPGGQLGALHRESWVNPTQVFAPLFL